MAQGRDKGEFGKGSGRALAGPLAHFQAGALPTPGKGAETLGSGFERVSPDSPLLTPILRFPIPPSPLPPP